MMSRLSTLCLFNESEAHHKEVTVIGAGTDAPLVLTTLTHLTCSQEHLVSPWPSRSASGDTTCGCSSPQAGDRASSSPCAFLPSSFFCFPRHQIDAIPSFVVSSSLCV